MKAEAVGTRSRIFSGQSVVLGSSIGFRAVEGVVLVVGRGRRVRACVIGAEGRVRRVWRIWVPWEREGRVSWRGEGDRMGLWDDRGEGWDG